MVVPLSIIAFLLIFYKLFSSIRSSESLELLIPFSSSADWQTLVHRTHNAYLTWRPSPIVNYFLELISGSGNISSRFYLEACAFIFSLGLFALLYLEKHSFISLVLSSLFTFSFLILFGLDFVIISSISWLPLLLCLLWNYEKFFQDKIIFFYALLLAISFLILSSANSLAPILIIGSFFSASFLNKKFPLKAFFISFSFTLFLSFFSQPLASFPSYPKLARVVADDGIEGVFSPLLGQFYELQVINFDKLSEVFFTPSLFICFLSLAFSIGFFASKNKFNKNFLLALIFAALSVFETFPDRVVSVNFPLSLLSRIVPNAFLFPLAGFSLFFSLLFFLQGLYLFYNEAKLSIYYSLLVFILFYLGNSSERLGLLQLPVLDKNLILLNEAKIENKALVPANVLVSPSYAILKEEGVSAISGARILDIISFEDLRNEVSEVTSTNQPELAKLTVDGDSNSIWDSGSSFQKGGETLAYRFKREISFDAIWIKLGGRYTDFPRGLKISVDSSCKNKSFSAFNYQKNNLVGKKTIYEAQNWQGVIRLNKDGYPYYGSQSEVKIILRSEVKAECLYLEQIGRGSNFAFSVSELLVHRTDKAL